MTLQLADRDVILAGGGLANALIAWRLKLERPEVRLLVVEADTVLGRDHTWSFHSSDVTAAQRAWLQPLVTASWPAQDIVFPAYARTLQTCYNAISGERIHDVIGAALGPDVMFGARVRGVEPNSVSLEDGRQITAYCVIDGRGFSRQTPLALSYQKFVGIEMTLADPHGLTRPIIMDATVAQHDGYRFVYCLPFDDRRLLVEDTYYSESPELDRELLRGRIHDYVAARGWRRAAGLSTGAADREESGVLPIVLDGEIGAFWQGADAGVPRAGLGAGLFHPTTGYSLPYAVRLAAMIATMPDLRSEPLARRIRALAANTWDDTSFFRLLNRLLFIAADGGERRAIFERFYELPEPLIQRFYAGRLTSADKGRIMIGRPPVSLIRAARSIPPSSAWAFAARTRARSLRPH